MEPGISITMQSAQFGDMRLQAYGAQGVGMPQTVLVVSQKGVTELLGWVVLPGDVALAWWSGLASKMLVRLPSMMQQSAGSVERDGMGRALRLSRDQDWGLTTIFEHEPLFASSGGKARWRMGVAGLGMVREVMECVSQIGDADVGARARIQTASNVLFGPEGCADLGVIAALNSLQGASEWAAGLAQVVRQVNQSRLIEIVACERCGGQYARKTHQAWRGVCAKCFGAGKSPQSAESSLSGREEGDNALEQQINDALAIRGERLRRGIVAPWVVVRVAGGRVTRANVRSLQDLAASLGLPVSLG